MNSPQDQKIPKRTRGSVSRRVAMWLGVIVLVLGIAGALAIYYLPVIARPVVRAAVAGLNIGTVDFTIERIGWRSASISGIALGDPEGQDPFLVINQARITYDPFDLLGGRTDSLTLDGVHMRARLRDGALDLGVLDPLLARASSGGEGADGAPPFARVALQGGQLDLETPEGLVTALLDGDVVLVADNGASAGIIAALDVAVSGSIATGSGRVRAETADGAMALVIEDLMLETQLAALQGALALSGGAVSLEVDANDMLDAWVSGDVAYKPDVGAGISSVYGSISMAAVYDMAAARGDVRLEECAPLTVTFEKGAGFSFEGMKLCPQEDVPLLAVDMSGDAPDIRATAQMPPISFSVGNTMRGMAPEMVALATLAGGAPVIVAVDLQGGDMVLPGQRIGMRDIKGRMTLAAADARGDQAARLLIDKVAVRDLDAAARFAPIQASADLSLDTTGKLSGPVRVATPTGTRLVEGEMQHVLSTGRGKLKFQTGTLTFSKGGLQPQRLAPVLLGVVAAVSGDVAATGQIVWTRNGVVSSGARMVIANVGLQASAARFDGIAGTIEFSSLVPVRTDGAQKISIAVLDAGVPLSGGVALVDVRDNGDVIIENAQWPFAGGQLVLTSGALNTTAKVQQAELSAVQVDLQQLLTMINLEGLTGEGELEGAVPIEIRDGSVFVTHAVLAAKPGGVLRYSTAGTQAAAQTAEGANIAFQALENFHFQVLSVEIDGPVDGDLTLKVVLQGANPDLLEGYPVHMNITTQGAFMDLMRRGTVGFRALDIVSGKENLGGIDVQRVDPEP